jgi:hypothetical protein
MAPAAISPLFTGLVDDAGLFPPESLPMRVATARHRGDTAAGHPVLTHRFLCPAARLPGLLDALGPGDRVRLGLITPLDPSSVRDAVELAVGDPRIELSLVEGPLPAGPDAAAAARQALAVLNDIPKDTPAYVEVPLGGGGRRRRCDAEACAPSSSPVARAWEPSSTPV